MNFYIEYECEADGRWLAEVPEIPGVLTLSTHSCCLHLVLRTSDPGFKPAISGLSGFFDAAFLAKIY